MTEDFKARLENIVWRVNEADKNLDEAIDVINDRSIDVEAARDNLVGMLVDIHDIIDGIKFNANEMLK